jgi:hypothetical protein
MKPVHFLGNQCQSTVKFGLVQLLSHDNHMLRKEVGEQV